MKRTIRLLSSTLTTCILASALILSASATELKSAIGVVTAGSLRLRAKPNTTSDCLDYAQNGDSVVIIRKVGDWYLVDYNLQNGYVHSDYIQYKERENVELGYGVVEATRVNIRSNPSTSSEIVTQATAGEKVFIFGFNTGWYKVKYNSQIGYIRSDLVKLTEKPYENSGSAASSGSSSGSSSSGGTSVTTIGQSIVTYSKQFLGTPYVWGGTSTSGFDCSGFTQYVMKAFGYSINRTASQQLSNGTSVSYSNLQQGDLVFFNNTYASSAAATHVGIYIGGNQFIHSGNSRTGVVISNLNDSYWYSRFVGGRRIAG